MEQPTLITSLDEITGPGIYAHPDRPNDWIEIHQDEPGFCIALAGLLTRFVGGRNRVRYFKTVSTAVRFIQRRMIDQLRDGQKPEYMALGAFVTPVMLAASEVKVRKDKRITHPIPGLAQAYHDGRRDALHALGDLINNHPDVTLYMAGAADAEFEFRGYKFRLSALT